LDENSSTNGGETDRIDVVQVRVSRYFEGATDGRKHPDGNAREGCIAADINVASDICELWHVKIREQLHVLKE